MQAIAGPESAFDPLYSQLILRICAAMNRLDGGGGAKTEFAPGRGETPGTTLFPSTHFFKIMNFFTTEQLED